MAEPDLTYEQARAGELRQLAYLCGEFRDALMLAKIPSFLADDLVRAWFCDELEDGVVTDFEDD